MTKLDISYLTPNGTSVVEAPLTLMETATGTLPAIQRFVTVLFSDTGPLRAYGGGCAGLLVGANGTSILVQQRLQIGVSETVEYFARRQGISIPCALGDVVVNEDSASFTLIFDTGSEPITAVITTDTRA